MKFSSGVCLRITIISSAVLSLSGHAILIYPEGPEPMTNPCRGECAVNVTDIYNDKWFTTGTAPGCKATGENKPPGKFCEKGMEPTLKSLDQLSYPTFYEDGDCNLSIVALIYNNDTKECAKDMEFRQAEVDKGNVSASIFSGNPWFAPGNAPIVDSCGVLGGWKYANARDYIAGPNDDYYLYTQGDLAPVNSQMPPINMDPPAGTLGSTVLSWTVNTRMQNAQGDSVGAYPIVWTAGETVEGSYSIGANHGGGHQYRLCPLDNLINDTLDETCFQANVMEFINDKSLFIATSDDGTVSVNITFDAMDIDDNNTDGVMPKGSTWRKLGIPPCTGSVPLLGGIYNKCPGPQFTNHSPLGYFGYGNHPNAENSPDLEAVVGRWKIVDELKVPESLSGDYVVSWRWDSEQTPQVWTQCSIVTIIDPKIKPAPTDAPVATFSPTLPTGTPAPTDAPVASFVPTAMANFNPTLMPTLSRSSKSSKSSKSRRHTRHLKYE